MSSNVHHATIKLFWIFLLLHSLAAYAINGVPLPWLSQAGILVLCGWILSQNAISLPKGSVVFLLLLTYAIITTFTNSFVEDYSLLMPRLATTSYEIFVALRFLNFGSFFAFFLVTYYLLRKGYEDRLIAGLTWLAVFVSLAGVYIYLAEIKGWPEPPRTRIGTSGKEQSTVFTYAFHRALGTFREPSHLAEWLIMPFFISFLYESKLKWILVSTITVCFLLTGSLTGIISVVVGLGVLLIFGGKAAAGTMIKFSIPLIIGLIGFSLFVFSNNRAPVSLQATLWDRIEPMLEEKGGLKKSNRNYVYDYFGRTQIEFFGRGLGNANIEFSRDQKLDATASFLNLYINSLFSFGIFGSLLFLGFILVPVVQFLKARSRANDQRLIYFFAAFIGWLVAYMIHSEELSTHFAILYALNVYKAEMLTVSSARMRP